jgi:hypothetical protein
MLAVVAFMRSRRPARAGRGPHFDVDGGDLGEMRLGDLPIKVDEEMFLGPGRRFRVLDVVPVDEEDPPYAGFLKVEPA